MLYKSHENSRTLTCTIIFSRIHYQNDYDLTKLVLKKHMYMIIFFNMQFSKILNVHNQTKLSLNLH